MTVDEIGFCIGAFSICAIVVTVWLVYFRMNVEYVEIEQPVDEDAAALDDNIVEYRGKLIDQVVQYVVSSYGLTEEDAKARFYRADLDTTVAQFLVTAEVTYIYTISFNWRKNKITFAVELLNEDCSVNKILKQSFKWQTGLFIDLSKVSDIMRKAENRVLKYYDTTVNTLIQEIATMDREDFQVSNYADAVYNLALYLKCHPELKGRKCLYMSLIQLVQSLKNICPEAFDAIAVQLHALPKEVLTQYENKDDK